MDKLREKIKRNKNVYQGRQNLKFVMALKIISKTVIGPWLDLNIEFGATGARQS